MDCGARHAIRACLVAMHLFRVKMVYKGILVTVSPGPVTRQRIDSSNEMTKTKSNRVPKQKMAGAFPTIECIPYKGPDRKTLAFKHYNAGEIVEGRTMWEHLRFSVVYWHTFRGTGSDPFGAGTMLRPWDDGSTR